jgi:acidic type I keratin
MNNKYFIYALFVTILTTLSCWANLVKSASGSSGGSSWSSRSYGGSGGYGGGYSGGGHK